MVERRLIRIALPYGHRRLLLDGAEQKGGTYDFAVAFGKCLKRELGLKDSALPMVVVPTRRDQLLQMLVDGKADVAAGALTHRAERKAHGGRRGPACG